MVTLITEKLQNQSLDDLARSSYDAGPVSQRPRAHWPTRASSPEPVHTGPVRVQHQ